MVKSQRKSKDQQGFTIVELLIATSVFSVVLLIASAGVIRLGQLYYKGITEAKTQEVTRQVFDEITRSVQFSRGVVSPVSDSALDAAGIKQFCIGDTRYTYKINEQIRRSNESDDSGPTQVGLKTKRIGSSDPCAGDSSGDQQLLAANMRLLDFQQPSPTGDSFTIKIKVAYGDNDLLTIYNDDGELLPAAVIKDGQCKPGIAGSSFCAVAQLDTIVKKRLQ